VTHVAQAATKHAVPAYSVRLEDQLLANLRYLPVSFHPTVHTSPPATTTSTTTTTLGTTATTTTTTTLPTTTTTHKKQRPPSPTKLVPGTFKWRFTSLPPILRAQWRVGTDNIVLRGAVMRFQLVHNLATTGSTDGATWKAIVGAALQHRGDPSSYNFVYVDQTLPEKARLYVNGKLAFTSLVNTGISVAPTAKGTYPVYLRYVTTTMSGTNPDGSHYSDAGIPWVSYFNGGDALHGFIRSTYGWPQSLGCVEMPFVDAAALWPHTPIGTLVSVQ